MNRQEILEKGRQMYVYEISEQADLKEEDPLDGLWYSMYDVCKLVHFGILDDVTEEEFEEAVSFLKEIQPLTSSYQDYVFEF